VHRAAISAVPVPAVTAAVVVLATTGMAPMPVSMPVATLIVAALLVQGQNWTSILDLKGADHLTLRLAPEILLGGEFDHRCDVVAGDEGPLPFKSVSDLACDLSTFEEFHILDHHYLRISEAY
jgi:hypothetical protein